MQDRGEMDREGWKDVKWLIPSSAGDRSLKHNEFLPPEEQIVTANLDISTVSIFSISSVPT